MYLSKAVILYNYILLCSENRSYRTLIFGVSAALYCVHIEKIDVIRLILGRECGSLHLIKLTKWVNCAIIESFQEGKEREGNEL